MIGSSMIKLHPEILRRDGKEQFAVLPYEEFVAVQELLEDLEDNRLIDEAKAQDTGEPGVSLEELKRRLDVK
ncbi:MAG: Phd YefM [Phycisphaerales bacterium]|nr:Phd YefM [Phycisphaerales bacterium]